MTEAPRDPQAPRSIADVLLPGLPLDYIEARYRAAPGNEIGSGKFFSEESSACLVANAFGPFFLSLGHRPPLSSKQLPPLPGLGTFGNIMSVELEAEVRFPWAGGRHPWLDVLIETDNALIGIESKRYEPFRAKKKERDLSDAYDRDRWGERMSGYKAILARLRTDPQWFTRVDAAQLVKHAFALRTAVQRETRSSKGAVLYYLYAEPGSWPDGKTISVEMHAAHRAEIEAFARLVEGDEVGFHTCSYRELLANWQAVGDAEVKDHAAAMLMRFAV